MRETLQPAPTARGSSTRFLSSGIPGLDSVMAGATSKIICSCLGYPGLEVVERGLVAKDAPFMEKPFTPESLAFAVRSLLERTADRA